MTAALQRYCYNLPWPRHYRGFAILFHDRCTIEVLLYSSMTAALQSYCYTLPWPRHYRVIAILFHDRGSIEVLLYTSMTAALEGGEWSASRPCRTLPPRKDPVPILQEAGWVAGPVWTGAENLVLTGIRSRTVQPVAQSLYRLSYPAHRNIKMYTICKPTAHQSGGW